MNLSEEEFSKEKIHLDKTTKLLRETIGNYRMLFYAIILIGMMLITSNENIKSRLNAYLGKVKGLVVKEKKGEVK